MGRVCNKLLHELNQNVRIVVKDFSDFFFKLYSLVQYYECYFSYIQKVIVLNFQDENYESSELYITTCFY